MARSVTVAFRAGGPAEDDVFEKRLRSLFDTAISARFREHAEHLSFVPLSEATSSENPMAPQSRITWHGTDAATVLTLVEAGESACSEQRIKLGADGDQVLVSGDSDDTAAVVDPTAEPVVLIWSSAEDAEWRAVPTRLTVAGDSVRVELVPEDQAVAYPVLLRTYYGSGSGGSGGASGDDIRWCAPPSRWRLCAKANTHKNKAVEKAEELYPGTLHNGRGDAFRHCYWLARMTVDFGAETAIGFGERHENKGDPEIEKEMDGKNNGRGVRVGETVLALAEDDESLDKVGEVLARCRNLADGGHLWVIADGTLVQR